ncbi:MAG TPA: hypothetical protein VMH22_07145 [bacterium]|nr:hypothetical protein [bacterium]
MFILLLAALTATKPGDSHHTGVVPLPPVHDTAVVVAVSPRLGTEIHARASRSFHLFPGVEDFTSAVFLRMPDSTYLLKITADSAQAAQQYPITQEQFRRIGYYVDHFEDIVPELAALPGGQAKYFDLWQGIGQRPVATEAYPVSPPPPAAWTSRVVDGLTGVACGLGCGGTIGAMSAISFVESKPESLLISDCLTDTKHWYHYSVDIYDVNQGTYAADAGAGLAVGAGTGILLGNSQAHRSLTETAKRKGVAGYDFFGDPIADLMVRQRMPASNRTLCTFLGVSSGWVVGTSVGLLATAIVRSIVFHPNAWDTIIIRHDGFTLDLPLIAFSLGGTLRGAYIGYRYGEQQDWKEAVEDIKRERLGFNP